MICNRKSHWTMDDELGVAPWLRKPRNTNEMQEKLFSEWECWALDDWGPRVYWPQKGIVVHQCVVSKMDKFDDQKANYRVQGGCMVDMYIYVPFGNLWHSCWTCPIYSWFTLIYPLYIMIFLFLYVYQRVNGGGHFVFWLRHSHSLVAQNNNVIHSVCQVGSQCALGNPALYRHAPWSSPRGCVFKARPLLHGPVHMNAIGLRKNRPMRIEERRCGWLGIDGSANTRWPPESEVL